jgi:hypothetical protein
VATTASLDAVHTIRVAAAVPARDHVDGQYREASAARRRAALDDMTREAEELGLYD